VVIVCHSQPEDNIDLEGLEKFAKEFKRRRIELGKCCYIIIIILYTLGIAAVP